ncbi:MAG: LUD domain-containing protein [Bacteroidia bacterium]
MKNSILSRIRQNKPPEVALPEIPQFDRPAGALKNLFEETLKKVGGQAVNLSPEETFADWLNNRFPDARNTAGALLESWKGNVELTSISDPHELENLDVMVMEGEFGVAENAAIWVTETALGHRAAPFICQHLVIFLSAEQLVWNMHEAYERIGSGDTGFGLFISGPSKTADIEQSLVIGAHGPRSLTVVWG